MEIQTELPPLEELEEEVPLPLEVAVDAPAVAPMLLGAGGGLDERRWFNCLQRFMEELGAQGAAEPQGLQQSETTDALQ